MSHIIDIVKSSINCQNVGWSFLPNKQIVAHKYSVAIFISTNCSAQLAYRCKLQTTRRCIVIKIDRSLLALGVRTRSAIRTVGHVVTASVALLLRRAAHVHVKLSKTHQALVHTGQASIASLRQPNCVVLIFRVHSCVDLMSSFAVCERRKIEPTRDCRIVVKRRLGKWGDEDN